VIDQPGSAFFSQLPVDSYRRRNEMGRTSCHWQVCTRPVLEPAGFSGNALERKREERQAKSVKIAPDENTPAVGNGSKDTPTPAPTTGTARIFPAVSLAELAHTGLFARPWKRIGARPLVPRPDLLE
jgi:hypothetical protein